MDERLSENNLQHTNVQHYLEHDAFLKKISKLPYVYESTEFKKLPINTTGLYTLTGGGQTGKTTLAKRWIARLLDNGIAGELIHFFPCTPKNHSQEMISLLQTHLSKKQNAVTQYLILDDITYIHDWGKIIKFIEETGFLNRIVLLLISADSTLHQQLQNLSLNNKIQINLHLYPLSFHDVIALKYPNAVMTDVYLFDEFKNYLMHGGYLPAINDMAMHRKILDETLKNYSAWLRNEMLHRGRQEYFLLEILTAITKHYNDPITWNMLSRELSINHPKTIADYVSLLEACDVTKTQLALLENTLTPAPKKARKLMFTDPFIFHAIRSWITLGKDIFESQIQPLFDQSDLCSKLVEGCVITHYQRHYPTYYIKAEGQISLAYINERRFWPVMVTWTNQLRAKDLKQIIKYPNGKILAKTQRSGIIEHIRSEPLPQALWRLDERS